MVGCVSRVCRRLRGRKLVEMVRRLCGFYRGRKYGRGREVRLDKGRVWGVGWVRAANFSWSMAVRVVNMESMTSS